MNKAERDRLAEIRLDSLIARGFDASTVEPWGRQWSDKAVTLTVKCSQCAAAVINGIAAHETGCPHATHECKGCNALLTGRQVWCEDCR